MTSSRRRYPGAESRESHSVSVSHRSVDRTERSSRIPKITIIEPPIPPELLVRSRKYSLNTFVINRDKGMSVNGFDLEFNGRKLLTGKYNSSLFGDSSVTIKDYRDNTIGQLEIFKRNTEFVCTVEGECVFACRVVHPGNNTSLSRRWTCYIYNGSREKKRLISKDPSISNQGKYVLYFGGKLTIGSVKNTILIDEAEKFEVIGIRKIDKNSLEIDARNDYSEFIAFCVGMCSFIAR